MSIIKTDINIDVEAEVNRVNAPTDFGRIYTKAEFEALPEFSEPYELINGKLVKKPMPGQEHSLIARRLIRRYDRFDPDEQIGQMLQETSVVLDVPNVLIPDVAFWTAARKLTTPTKGAAPLPDLAVEVWSPHDLETKKRQSEARKKIRKYQLAGVPLIWAVNPEKQEVEVYHPDQEQPVQVLKDAEMLEGEAVIPGFTLKVADLFG